MKKLLSTVCVLFSLLSCGGGGEKESEREDLQIDSVSASGVCSLTDEPTSPRCEVAISLQYAVGERAKEINQAVIESGIIAQNLIVRSATELTMQQIADTIVSRYLRDYKEFYARLYANDRLHPKQYDCRYKLSTKLSSYKHGVITTIADVYQHAGGHYPVHKTVAKNIETDSCKVLTTDDLYLHGYEKTLRKIIVEKLCEKFGAGDLDGLMQQNVLADGDVYISQNFIVGENEVVFIYCDSEIAPHEAGEIRIAVSNKEMYEFVKQ